MRQKVSTGWLVGVMALGWLSAAPALAEEEAPVVAVFGIDIRIEKLSAQEQAGLSDYLSARLGEGGHYRIIPRGDLHKAIQAQKTTSYQNQYDTRTQIAVGQELAASFSISSTISMVGKFCLVHASVWDLRRAVQIKAATNRGPCGPEDLVGAIEKIADVLTGAMDAQSSHMVPTQPVVQPGASPTVVQPAPVVEPPKVAMVAAGKPVASQYMSLPTSTFNVDDTIALRWDKAPTQRRDWIAVARAGTTDEEFENYMYTGTEGSGVFQLSGLEAGDYEARLYLDYDTVGYKAGDRLAFRVGTGFARPQAVAPAAGATRSQYLAVAKAVYAKGEPVVVQWFGTPGNSRDWLCVVPKSSDDNDAGTYDYTTSADGSFTVNDLEPGDYEARIYLDYRNVGYKVADRVAFSVR